MNDIRNKYNEKLEILAEKVFSNASALMVKIVVAVVAFLLIGFLFCTESGRLIILYVDYIIFLIVLVYTFFMLYKFGMEHCKDPKHIKFKTRKEKSEEDPDYDDNEYDI